LWNVGPCVRRWAYIRENTQARIWGHKDGLWWGWHIQALNATWQLVLGEGLVTLSKVGHFWWIAKQVSWALQWTGSDKKWTCRDILQGAGFMS
jgi:hypothetical protein